VLSRRTALLCGMLLLSACAAVPRAPVAVDPAQVSAFDLTGRINVRVENKGYPGRIRWQHAPGSDEVWVYSPVGSTVARMRQDALGALLVTSDGKEYKADDLKLLAREMLGWNLPIDGLQYWVRGLPSPSLDRAREEHDADGRLKSLSQGGWEVAYLDWSPAEVAGLPSKLDVAGEGLRLRLLIEKWKVEGGNGPR